MKRWDELTDEQRVHVHKAFNYLLSDQWYIDAIRDIPEVVNDDLRKHGYDPATMTEGEKLDALKWIEMHEED